MPNSTSESNINLLQETPSSSLISCTPFPFLLLASLFSLIGQALVIIKSLTAIPSLLFWGSDLSLAYRLFYSALILIHALESESLKGPLPFHCSQPVSISTLIEWRVFNIGLLQQAIIFYPKVLPLAWNKRMLTQRLLFCFVYPSATTFTWLEKKSSVSWNPVLAPHTHLKTHVFSIF